MDRKLRLLAQAHSSHFSIYLNSTQSDLLQSTNVNMHLLFCSHVNAKIYRQMADIMAEMENKKMYAEKRGKEDESGEKTAASGFRATVHVHVKRYVCCVEFTFTQIHDFYSFPFYYCYHH